MTPKLSKSRFLAGLQCPLRLWNQCYRYDLATKPSPSQQSIFYAGHEVGLLATKLYAGGYYVQEDYMHHEEARQSTAKALDDRTVPAIFEGAFLHDDIRIRADVLQRLDGSKWNMIEVKSTTSVKEIHITDAAVQFYVLAGTGLNIDHSGILHLSNQYVYDGNSLNLNELFSFCDLTKEVLRRQDQIRDELQVLKNVVSCKTPPSVSPSRHCMKPYRCEFFEACTKDVPEYWIMELGGVTENKFNQMTSMGIESIGDIPDGFPLSPVQQRIRDCVRGTCDFISPYLKLELEDVAYPLHFLDFETVGPAVPRYAGTRPYEGIPFQWSDHILSRDGSVDHREYLCSEDKDPRSEFAQALIEAIGEQGTIFTYTGYERGILKALAVNQPRLAEDISRTLPRLKDLHAVVSRHYYHPLFHGSFSLKSVLPALVPGLDYKELKIQEGTIASSEYLRMIDARTPDSEKQTIKRDLLKYCGTDTLGMLRIRDELLKRASK
jgi:predicted RecB family nuclease